MSSTQQNDDSRAALRAAEARMDTLCDLPIVTCETTEHGHRIAAVYGSPPTEASFKAILGLGLLILARQHAFLAPGQPVIESSSGSLGVGLALAGRSMGHPVHIVTDTGAPAASRAKMLTLGAELHIVDTADPVLGFQESRDRLLGELIRQHPDWYWTQQNDNELNPEVYRRWLIPSLAGSLDVSRLAAGIFCVGSGGHFTAFAEYLGSHGIESYVADRVGSITFGGDPGPSQLRGTGNQNRVPGLIQRSMHLVRGVYRVDDAQAVSAMKDLLCQGISAGGSSGACLHGARDLSKNLPPPDTRDTILTFLPDRGELYPELLATEE